MNRYAVAVATLALALATGTASGTLDEWKIARQEVFEFEQPPTVRRKGDAIAISFALKAACDVTVAIEDAQGNILRHLASGVPGANAPAPFLKNTLSQTLVWDGKNDQGQYVDDKDSLTVRVSLGLKPEFEKDLFFEPKRRHGRNPPVFQVQEEGVYVYDGGNGLDFVILYDHQGEYARTVYPFPADKIDQVKGLHRVTYPQDGLTLPIKPTFLQQTFLTAGNTYGYALRNKDFTVNATPSYGGTHYAMYGNASSILAVNNGRLALGHVYLNRLATDGSSGGMDFEGPSVALLAPARGRSRGLADLGEEDSLRDRVAVVPRGSALSPDGKTLYLTGYNFCYYGRASADIITSGAWEAFHGVMKMEMDRNDPPVLFAGSEKLGEHGSDNKSFKIPASVATDSAGRVYVADHLNDRIQILSPDGTFLKTLKVANPAIVSIDAKTQDLYVFSGLIHNIFHVRSHKEKGSRDVQGLLTVFGPFDNPKEKLSIPLPQGYGTGQTGYLYAGSGFPMSAAVNGYTDPPTIWLAREWARENVMNRGRIQQHNIEVYALEKNKLVLKHDFGKSVAASVKRASPAVYARPRLYVNPRNGRLYVAEGDAFTGKSFKTLIEIDPNSGRLRIIPIPFDAEDMTFDHRGFAYLRTVNMVVRYDAATWREIPWDYGEERRSVHTSSSSDRKTADVISGVVLPADGHWHHGGLAVSLKGHLAVACGLGQPDSQNKAEGATVQSGSRYAPAMFPGRGMGGRAGTPLIHIWDQHGKLVHEDILPGIAGDLYGLGLDTDNAVTLMASAVRSINGKPYLNPWTGTIVKARPNQARILSQSNRIPIQLPQSDYLPRPPDLHGGALRSAWIDGHEWLYGAVGFMGKNHGNGCACWNSRMAYDYFDRTFAPELERYRVAVLDSAGNLILRIGQYGNADSGGPDSLVPLKGDGVGMTHGAYLAAHTDKRLFIADPANDRIFSVALGYHAEQRVSLQGIPDAAP